MSLSLLNVLPHPLLRYIKRNYQKLAFKQWLANRKPVPPPHIVKVNLIKTLSQKYPVKNIIETGTYMGDMLDELKRLDLDLYSIELDTYYYSRAKNIFRLYSNIHLIQGDSGQQLSKLLKNINAQTLFWLDAHFSGGKTARAALDTPIIQELQSIASHHIKNHIILIDDARLFVGDHDYPTLKEMKEFCAKFFPKHSFQVIDDMIQILSK